MDIQDYDYPLPPHLIAQSPASERTAARLLRVQGGHYEHLQFADIKRLLQPGDLLVLNNTKVIKARAFGRKDSGGQVEILLERVLDEFEVLCQLRASKAVQTGRQVHVGDFTAHCLGREGEFFHLRFDHPALEVFDTHGQMPLPPYIRRAEPCGADVEDETRYQTVFAQHPGAVAAPTAGLHFSAPLLTELAAMGVQVAYITLHVGAGTFQPVRGQLSDHVMHYERFSLPPATATAINATRNAGGRVVAVGTTVVRTVESVYAQHGHMCAASGETNLFIQPGFEFKGVDVLVTNFHLPRSTLLLLVSAFAGQDTIMAAYAEAVACEYRFFSYGDAMWLQPEEA